MGRHQGRQRRGLGRPDGGGRDCPLPGEGQTGGGIRNLAASSGAQALLDYLADIKSGWEMQHYTLERIFADGDDVAAVIDCAWTNRATGKTFAGTLVNVWTFKDGVAVDIQEFMDTAALVAAETP